MAVHNECLIQIRTQGNIMNKPGNLFKVSAMASLFITLFLSACNKTDPEKIFLNEQLTSEAIGELAPAMMKNLHEKVDSEGYAGAVTFCNIFSPKHGKQKNQEILEKFKSTYGVEEFSIRRISLKNRNPKAVGDNATTDILQNWEDQLTENAGTPVDLKTKTYYSNGYYTTLKPIRIPGKFCQGCHGSIEERDPMAYEKIRQLYPDDKAIDYNVGDLRGAFVVKIKYAK